MCVRSIFCDFDVGDSPYGVHGRTRFDSPSRVSSTCKIIPRYVHVSTINCADSISHNDSMLPSVISNVR